VCVCSACVCWDGDGSFIAQRRDSPTELLQEDPDVHTPLGVQDGHLKTRRSEWINTNETRLGTDRKGRCRNAAKRE